MTLIKLFKVFIPLFKMGISTLLVRVQCRIRIKFKILNMASTVFPDLAAVALYPHFPSLNPVLFSQRDLLTPDLPEPVLPHGWHTCCPQCLEQTSVALTSQQLADSYSSFISPFKSHFREAFLIPAPLHGCFQSSPTFSSKHE